MATRKKFTKGGSPVLVQSAIEDGQGRQIDETYVEHNSYDGTLSVGYSDSTGAIKTKYGVELNAGATIDGHLDEPFLFRPTAYPFNRDVITIGGQKATVKQVRAYAFVKNQLVQYDRNGTWTGTNVYKDIGRVKVSDTNRKILIIVDAKSTNSLSQVYAICRSNGSYAEYRATNYLTTNFTRTTLLFTGSNYDANGIILRISNDGRQENTIDWKNLTVIDLTKWFNNDTTILSKTNETWFVPWFLNNFGKYIPTYSIGEIENTYATKITTNGVNQWDEEWEIGDISTGNGQPVSSTTSIRSKNYTRVAPNTTYFGYVGTGKLWVFYYDVDYNWIGYTAGGFVNSTFTTPSNCIYIKITHNAGTYANNIQICLHWTEPTIEQTYHLYEKWVFNIDWSAIGTPLGINSQIGDYKDFVNGKNGKVVGSVDLGTLNYTLSGLNFVSNIISDIKIPATVETVANIICSLYNAVDIAKTFVELDFAINQEGKLYIRNTAYSDAAIFKAAMSGVILQYELAEPTLTDMTESEKLTNTYNVNDYGTEEFDEVCALDVLYQNNLVRQIVNNQTAIADHEQRIGALENSSGKLYRHCVFYRDGDYSVYIYLISTKPDRIADYASFTAFNVQNYFVGGYLLGGQTVGNEIITRFNTSTQMTVIRLSDATLVTKDIPFLLLNCSDTVTEL